MQANAVLSLIRLSKPEFKSNEDKLAFAVHSYVVAQGYKLISTGQAADVEGKDYSGDLEEVSIDGWNELNGVYAFRYQDIEGKKPALFVKCLVLGSQLVIQWSTTPNNSGDGATPIELSIDQYTTNEPAAPQAYKNTDKLMEVLDNSLGRAISPQQATKTSQKLQQEGTTASAAEQRQRQILDERAEEMGYMPYQGGSYGQGSRDLPPGILPTGVGYEDVVPPGVRPPGFLPDSGGGLQGLMEGPPRRGGGMEVGPDHPIFGPGKLGGGPGIHPGGQPGPSLPPGARWDPIGPPGMRGFRPDDFTRRDPSKPHPDMMQPGPGKGTDWDSFYG